MSTRISPHAQPRFSRSLEYGAAMLECFTAERPVLRISELADMISTTHRYATTLVELGYLEQDRKRKYQLTRKAGQPGMVVIDTIRRSHPARAILEDLRTQTGHTVSLGMLDGEHAVYIHRLSAHGAGQYNADGDLTVGAHVSVYDTALGKALLSTLLDSELQAYCRCSSSATSYPPRGLMAMTPTRSRPNCSSPGRYVQIAQLAVAITGEQHKASVQPGVSAMTSGKGKLVDVDAAVQLCGRMQLAPVHRVGRPGLAGSEHNRDLRRRSEPSPPATRADQPLSRHASPSIRRSTASR
jgi:DNA-binding IclR family transcriptional regulator